MSEATLALYRFKKNGREEVVASLTSYKGHELLDLRVFVPGNDGEPKATPKGLSLSRELLPELERAVAALRVAVDENR